MSEDGPEVKVLKDVELASVILNLEPVPYAPGDELHEGTEPPGDFVPDAAVDPAFPGATGSNGVIHGGR